jgi:acyl carrier protein
MCEIVEEEELAQGEERKFKNDGTFIIEFILVMIILLAATTAVLVTMLFRQKGVHDVSFWEQLGVVFAGYVAILFSRLIFSIGETQTVRRSMPTCLTQEAYQRRSERPLKQTQWWANEDFDLASLNEAKEAVVNILQDKLGVRREDCVMSADLVRDLGADELDIAELFMEYDKYLEHNYKSVCLFRENAVLNSYNIQRYNDLQWQMIRDHKNNSLSEDELYERMKQHNEEIMKLFPSVHDHCIFLAIFITAYKE